MRAAPAESWTGIEDLPAPRQRLTRTALGTFIEKLNEITGVKKSEKNSLGFPMPGLPLFPGLGEHRLGVGAVPGPFLERSFFDHLQETLELAEI